MKTAGNTVNEIVPLTPRNRSARSHGVGLRKIASEQVFAG